MSETINWEEKLQDDLVFHVNIIMQSMSFREKIGGYAFRKGSLTKTFRQWLETFDFGKTLLNEIKRREKVKRFE